MGRLTLFLSGVTRLRPRLGELFRPRLSYGPPKVIEAQQVPLPQDETERIAANGRRALLVLPAHQVLEKRVVLPTAAARHAGSAIDLEIRQSFPAHAKGLVWSFRRLQKDPERTEYCVYLVKEDLLEATVSGLARSGVTVQSVHAGTADFPALWKAPEPRLFRPAFWVIASLLLSACMFSVQAYSIHRETRELEGFAAQRAEGIRILEEKLKTATENEALVAETQKMIAEAGGTFLLERRRYLVLADLSRILPDDTWISELTISGPKLEIAGFTSGKVTELVAAIQEVDWVKSAALNGSTLHDPYSGQDRFAMSIDLQLAGRSP